MYVIPAQYVAKVVLYLNLDLHYMQAHSEWGHGTLPTQKKPPPQTNLKKLKNKNSAIHYGMARLQTCFGLLKNSMTLNLYVYIAGITALV